MTNHSNLTQPLDNYSVQETDLLLFLIPVLSFLLAELSTCSLPALCIQSAYLSFKVYQKGRTQHGARVRYRDLFQTLEHASW